MLLEVEKGSGLVKWVLSRMGMQFDRALNRTFCLFACGCCRRNWNLLTEESWRRAIEASEQFADRRMEARAMRATARAASESLDHMCAQLGRANANASPSVSAASAAISTAQITHWNAKKAAIISHMIVAAERKASARSFEKEFGLQYGSHWLEVYRQQESYMDEHTGGRLRYYATDRAEQYQCHLLRDLVGNPFRPVSIQLEWLWWNGGTVRRLAETIYDTRDFSLLPLLADALTDAGCNELAIIDHCRKVDIHARGCWVVDAMRSPD